jgi:hypothetical protein
MVYNQGIWYLQAFIKQGIWYPQVFIKQEPISIIAMELLDMNNYSLTKELDRLAVEFDKLECFEEQIKNIIKLVVIANYLGELMVLHIIK